MGILDVAGAERTAFIESLEAMLRPLMPVMLKSGVTYTDAEEVLRSLFIETTGTKIGEQGRPATPARLALIAGLNRGEVIKLSEKKAARDRIRALRAQRLDQVSAVLAVWHDDSRFNTPYGAPLDLSLAPEGGFQTIQELFKVACPEVPQEQLLDDLLSSGCVEIHAGRFVRCTSRAFMPGSADVSGIARVGRYGGAMNATFAHNLTRDVDDPSFFERTVLTQGLVTKSFRDEALAYLRANGQEFLEHCDRWITEREDQHLSPKGKRFGFSLFYYEEDADTALRTQIQG